MARDFNGTTQEGNFTAAINTRWLSLSLWVKFDTTTAYNGLLISRLGGSVAVGLNVSGDAGKPLGYFWENTADEYNAASGITLTAGRWKFIALVVTPTAATLYGADFGAALSSFVNTKAHTQKATSAWKVGSDSFSPNPFRGHDGAIADVALWPRDALGRSEIAALARGASPSCVRPGGLAAYFPMMQSLSPEPDRSGNGRNLALTNAPPASGPAPFQLLEPGRRSTWRRTRQRMTA